MAQKGTEPPLLRMDQNPPSHGGGGAVVRGALPTHFGPQYEQGINLSCVESLRFGDVCYSC